MSKWREVERKAKRNGLKGMVILPSGDRYKGEWKDDRMHGKGSYESKKDCFLYDGGFEHGQRCGYGVYSVQVGDGEYYKQYMGYWQQDKHHGQGVKFYDMEGKERYEGEWYKGRRSGWGRMHYSDGSIYEGEWLEDMRSGTGLLLLASGNRYEGSWELDKKHGDGIYYYVNKGQCYKGAWKEGTAKCGIMEDLDREFASDPTKYNIPELKLKNIDEVLQRAKEEAMSSNNK
eukprot:m.47741 g.47741  ORF g.47741 m.47741 type:complete len:231 (+) comp10786_c0_seq2:49-741(+)